MAKRSRRRRIVIWSFIGLGVIVVIFGLAALVTNLIVTQSAADYIVDNLHDAPPAQAAIVLGARVYANGTPSPMLVDRLETGIKLYETGKVKKLLLSGDHGQVEYDEVNVMLDYVLARGVPTEDVFTDHAGFDTYDTMYRAIEVFQVRSALIVTQEFHLARSVYTARQLGLDAVGVVADIQPYTDEFRNRMREWLARGKAILQLHITHPEPTYLGPSLPIDGDGRMTRG
jgi:SanA protein